MKLTNVYATALSLLPGLITAQQSRQSVLQSGDAISNNAAEINPINIAIIGAGAAGSSAAYHLHQYGITSRVPLNLTIFERNSYIGGRSTTVSAYDDTSLPVELGASIFVQVNHILTSAVEEFNLSTTGFNDNPKGIPGSELGIWDGEKFVLEINGGWWDTAKLIWKYGLAPIKTQRLTKSVVGKFLRMYNTAEEEEEAGVFPFKSLTQAVQDVGLLAVTAATGEQYMRESGITGDFGRHVVQASTRVNYAQNLKYIHGLEAMVCMATDGAMAVQGGNWRIFEKMVDASGAVVHLETSVSSVKEGKQDGYSLAFDTTGSDGVTITQHQDFDLVILAGPYQYTNITLPSSAVTPDTIPYVSLHVTLFTSPHFLSTAFFNLKSDQAVPQVILTTLPDSESPGQGNKTVGTPGFYSISLLRPILNPNTGTEEYLYKIFSASPVTSKWLAHLLNIKWEGDDEISDKDVTWIYRKVWNSYPYEYPRVTFEESRLDDGIWYTGGMDSFISTMETNALMGKNVARLVVDEVLGELGRVNEESDEEWVLLDEKDRFAVKKEDL